ncbi:MAG: hypothetical protein RDV48_12125 [Candidatus Eremiobacteraeota bacterium]|nr:hypothetical protein [Candidatus Eremiobacteraeota bacterium]
MSSITSPSRRAGWPLPSSGKGLSLIELIIAMVLLLLILFSVGILIPYSQVRMRNSAYRDSATTLAENLMERIRTTRSTNIPSTAVTYDGLAFPSPTPSPVTVGGVQVFPPTPYPRTTYQDFSGAQVKPGGPTQELRSSVEFIYVVRSDPVSYTPLTLIDISVYWDETSGASGGHRRKNHITVSSMFLRR